MAWSTPLTAVSNAALTAAQWNASVRDNLLETAPAKATTEGSHMAVSGAGTLAERIGQVVAIATAETTTLTSYGDLPAGTVGPTITATASARVLVSIHSAIANSSAGAEGYVSWDVTGAFTSGVSDNFAVSFESSAANDRMRASFVSVNVVTAGSSTYTCKYKVSAGTGTFSARRLSIVPF